MPLGMTSNAADVADGTASPLVFRLDAMDDIGLVVSDEKGVLGSEVLDEKNVTLKSFLVYPDLYSKIFSVVV